MRLGVICGHRRDPSIHAGNSAADDRDRVDERLEAVSEQLRRFTGLLNSPGKRPSNASQVCTLGPRTSNNKDIYGFRKIRAN
jgi:hypothetical protein